MLVSVPIVTNQALDFIHRERKLTQIEPGVYLNVGFNLSNIIPYKLGFEYEYPSIEGLDSYGVCDSPEQLLGKIQHLKDDPDRMFIVGFTEVRKDEQPPEGGWRWHKWGQYIGNHVHEFEYLYDEKDIEHVYTYSILELPQVLM